MQGLDRVFLEGTSGLYLLFDIIKCNLAYTRIACNATYNKLKDLCVIGIFSKGFVFVSYATQTQSFIAKLLFL